MNDGDYAQVLELVHPEIEAAPKSRPLERIRGADAAARFLHDFVATRSVFEIGLTAVNAVDEHRVVAQGRLRWMDDDRVLRDDPVVWAVEVEDGLLRRSTAVRTVTDAEALLATSAPSPGA